MRITCSIDWAENHHDVALVDEAGQLVGKRRISDDAEGYRRLLVLPRTRSLGVETACGLLISCLRTHRAEGVLD